MCLELKNDLTAKIPTFEEFLAAFGKKDITFSIELKVKDVEKATADMIYKYGAQDKVIITSFIYEALQERKENTPKFYF